MQFNYLLYALILIGFLLIFSQSVEMFFRQNAYKLEAARQKHASARKKRQKSMTHRLRQTFLALNSSPKSIRWNIMIFYISTAVLGLGGFLFFTTKVNLSFGILLGIIGMLSPTAFLYVRLQRMRVTSSYEGDVLINEFTNQYKIRYRNVLEALENTAANIPEAPLTSLGVLRLCQRLREVRKNSDIDEALDDFVFQIDTEWARKFALSLSAGLKDQVALDESLIDLADEISKARKIIEQRKRSNNESAVIIKYITIPLYLGTMVIGSRYMGSSAKEAFANQFGTATGLKYFAVIVIGYAICIALMIAFDNQKMDLE